MFDVQVIDPGSKSYVTAAQQPLDACRHWETRKRKEYETRCIDQGYLFFPVILECYGGREVWCRDLVNKIVEEATVSSGTNQRKNPPVTQQQPNPPATSTKKKKPISNTNHEEKTHQ